MPTSILPDGKANDINELEDTVKVPQKMSNTNGGRLKMVSVRFFRFERINKNHLPFPKRKVKLYDICIYYNAVLRSLHRTQLHWLLLPLAILSLTVHEKLTRGVEQIYFCLEAGTSNILQSLISTSHHSNSMQLQLPQQSTCSSLSSTTLLVSQ